MTNDLPAAANSIPDSLRVVTALGEFVRVSRLSQMQPHEEWMTILSHDTEVVVAARGNGPSPLGVEKAISIVQSRSYLGKRAVQLIAPFLKADGTWRLLTIDFGAEARRCASEFLMCFAFVPTNAKLSTACPYFEVGFELPKLHGADPLFRLTVKTVIGIPFP